MSRSVSAFTLVTLVSFAFLAAFTSATPTGVNNVSGLAARSATQSGKAIYYKVVGSGVCGYVESDDGFTVALARSDWEGGFLCGKKLEITNPATGSTRTAVVNDLCAACAAADDLGLSPSLFLALNGVISFGAIEVTWKVVGTAPN